MKLKLYYILIFCLPLSSCYFTDDIFDPPEKKEKSLQERAEKGVSNYLTTEITEKYKPYGFGKLIIHKPIEIQELEKLQLEKSNANENNPKLDSSIAQKERFIRKNNIERTLEIEHFFTLTDSLGRTKIFETTFELNDTLKVIDFDASIMLPIPSEYREILTYYFYEYPIFYSNSYEQSKKLSRDFYAFFKTELENRKGLTTKSDFLLHALNMCYQVKDMGSFNQKEILGNNVSVYIKKEKKEITEYSSLKFSDLYESTPGLNEEKTGYYFFHKFIGKFNDQLDTNVVLIEFNPFYEISNIYQMDRPFKQYFN
jgi:hypothetical protein